MKPTHIDLPTETTEQADSAVVKSISAAAAKFLVEMDPIPHILVDATNGTRWNQSEATVYVKMESLLETLTRLDTWNTEHAERRAKDSHLVVVLYNSTLGSNDNHEGWDADGDAFGMAQELKLNGWKRVVVSDSQSSQYGQEAGETEVKWIGKHALAGVLRYNLGQVVQLLDVRREEERELYGSIPESLSLPAEDFAVRDSTAADDAKLDKTTPVVVQCRTNRRAQFVAQLLHDDGFKHVLVLKEGSFDWDVDGGMVKRYASWETWQSPPKPEPRERPFAYDEKVAKEHILALHL